MNNTNSFISSLLQNPLLLAPMAGFTDVEFRTLCKRFGAGLTYTEMISAQGLSYENAKTYKYLNVSDEEKSAVVQLFGRDPNVMAIQAHRIQEKMEEKLVAIDINMGCPVRKVIKKGEGSALMLEPDLASEIVEEIAKQVEVPVTAKFRRGVYHEQEVAVEFAKRLEDSGVSAVAVHGRYARDFYKGSSDWEVIKKVKESVSIPVIASGDIFSSDDATTCMEQTNADAVMVARGALGNPWIFQKEKEYGKVELSLVVNTMRQHLELIETIGDKNLIKLRSHIPYYLKGYANTKPLKTKSMECKTAEDFSNLFDEIDLL